MSDIRLAVALAATLLLPTAAAAAQSDGPPADGGPAPTAAPTARPARAVACVLTVRGGQHLRGDARAVADGWEFTTPGGDVRFLPGRMVERCVEERVLLAALREHDRNGDAVAAATWALGEGLAKEALVRLDASLREDPSDARALAVLEAHAGRLPLAVPGLDELRASAADDVVDPARRLEQVERTLAAGARLAPAGRELAARELARLVPIDELGPLAYAELRRPEGARRAFGALVHARALPDRNLGSLVRQTLLDPSEDARTGGALALAQATDPRVFAALNDAFHADHAMLSLNATAALGLSNNEAAVPALATALLQGGGGITPPPRGHVFVGRQRAYVQDFDVEVAQNESVADPVINTLLEGAVLDVAVHSVQVTRTTRTRALRTALRRLTGSDPGASSRDHQRWWAERQAKDGPKTGA